MPALHLLRDDRRQLVDFAYSLLAGDYRHRLNAPSLKDWNAPDTLLRPSLRNCLNSRLDSPRQRQWKSELIRTLVEKSSDRVSHSDSTVQLTSLGASLSPKDDGRREAFFAAARACASAGLFQASQAFLDLGYARIELDAKRTSGFRDVLSAVLVSIQRGDKEAALGRWHSLSTRAVPEGITREVWASVNRYLAQWLGIEEQPSSSAVLNVVDSNWKELVGGRKVLVVGPAPRLQESGPAGHDLTARIYRGTALSDALGSPQREIMYLNNDPDLPNDELVPRQVVGRVSSISKLGMVGSARPA